MVSKRTNSRKIVDIIHSNVFGIGNEIPRLTGQFDFDNLREQARFSYGDMLGQLLTTCRQSQYSALHGIDRAVFLVRYRAVDFGFLK